MAMDKRKLFKIFHNTFFSLIVLLILVGGMYFIAESITENYRKKPDFGGIIMLRQTDMGVNEMQDLTLTREMILNHITADSVLLPIAAQHGWNVSKEEMLQAIDVKERQESFRSFLIHVNTHETIRSGAVARALAASFLETYKNRWKNRSRETLKQSSLKIETLEKELKKLTSLKVKFARKYDLQPANNELEMQSVNEQLVVAQKEFLTAYGNYINAMEEKCNEIQLKYDLALKIYTKNDKTVKNLKIQLDEMNRLCEKHWETISKQKPDLYSLSMEPKKLTGLPKNLTYYYENVQNLLQIKLSLMLKTLIEEKERELENERNKKNTIQRMLENDSCDVFIREI